MDFRRFLARERPSARRLFFRCTGSSRLAIAIGQHVEVFTDVLMPSNAPIMVRTPSASTARRLHREAVTTAGSAGIFTSRVASAISLTSAASMSPHYNTPRSTARRPGGLS